MKTKKDKVVLICVGLLLLTAALLKAHQVISIPLPNKDLWSYRPFVIFTIEFEFALSLWLFSGLFISAARLAAAGCFSLFSVITLYKALSGADSCGCFGSISVNPWITLLAIDLPTLVVLFAVNDSKSPFFSLRTLFAPLPKARSVTLFLIVETLVISLSTPFLSLNKPPRQTAKYAVFEPKNWISQKLPILDQIDIGHRISQGNWLILLYNHNCPDCIKAVDKYQKIPLKTIKNPDFLQIAFIEIPPYSQSKIDIAPYFTAGKLADSKDWFIATPAFLLLKDAIVQKTWEKQIPEINPIIDQLSSHQQTQLSEQNLKGGEKNANLDKHKIFNNKYL